MHAHDQVLQEQRLARYQQLFHISRHIPRQWRSIKEPTREELNEISIELHNWYFSEEAGGMFLTPTAQTRYLELQNALQETADASPSSPDSPLSPAEAQRLRDLAKELRYQLAQDVGAADPPRLKWGRPGPLLPPPRRLHGAQPLTPARSPRTSLSDASRPLVVGHAAVAAAWNSVSASKGVR